MKIETSHSKRTAVLVYVPEGIQEQEGIVEMSEIDRQLGIDRSWSREDCSRSRKKNHICFYYLWINQSVTDHICSTRDHICSTKDLLHKGPHLLYKGPHLVYKGPHLVYKEPQLVYKGRQLVHREPQLVFKGLQLTHRRLNNCHQVGCEYQLLCSIHTATFKQ